MAINNWWVSLRTALSMAAGSIPVHRSCILSARQILKTEDNKKSDSSKVNEAGRNFKATFFEDREIFQAVLHFCNCSSSPFPAYFFYYSSASLIQAAVRFLFTAWCHFRFDGQSGPWINWSKILKYFLLQFCVRQLSSEAFMHIWQKMLNLAVLDCWVALSWEWFQAGGKNVLSLLESCHHFNKCATHPLFLVLSSLPDSMSVLSRFLHQADFSSPKSFSLFLFLFLTLFPLPLSSHGAVVVARWKQLSEAVAEKARVIKAHKRLELCEGRWVTHQSQGTCACCSHLSL